MMQPSLDASPAPYTPPPSSDALDPRSRPRLWLTIVLSLFAPGAGHVYAGAGWQSLRACLITFLALATALLPLAPLVVWLAVALIPLLAAFDAVRFVRRSTARAPSAGAVAFAAVGFLVLSSVVGATVRETVVDTFSIPAANMAPGLVPGDLILVDERAYKDVEPARGDVVVFCIRTIPRSST